jgi:hypothetical protein
MRLNINRDEFDRRQRALVREIACSVKQVLEGAGLHGDKELAESLVFDFCSILDGSRVMEANGRPLLPFLTFADDRKAKELLAAESGSWLHEICGDAVEETLNSEPELVELNARLDRLLAKSRGASATGEPAGHSSGAGGTEPGASPNGGTAELPGKSGVSGGPPSVS